MQCTQSVDNTCVMSWVFITLLCNNYFPQKLITHKDLESLLHSFPSSPAVVCSGLWCILWWCVVVCGFQTYPLILTLTLLLTLINHNPHSNLKLLQCISHAGQ